MTVYAIHEPVRWDKRSKSMVPVDIAMAARWGELRVVLPGCDRPPPIARCAQEVREAMAGFRPGDYLLLAGDMDLVVFAAVLAAKAAGGHLSLLKWSAREWCYSEVSAPEGLLS